MLGYVFSGYNIFRALFELLMHELSNFRNHYAAMKIINDLSIYFLFSFLVFRLSFYFNLQEEPAYQIS